MFQLFEGNPGDVQLFEDLASAFEQHDKKCAPQDLAACLWRALESGLRTLHGNGANVVMILDGLDEFTSGGEDLAAFWAALHKSVHESNAHIITFSEVTPPGVDETSHIALEKTWNLSADIHAYLQQSLSELLCFTEPDATVGEEVIDSLVQKSGMSFLWARFVVQLFSNKVAPKLTSQALSEATCALSGSLAEDFEELLSKRVRKDKTTQAILSFMLVAYRPLTIAELAELTSVDVAGHKFRKSGDVLAHIKSTCSDIVVVEHGALRFRNKLIRKHVHALRSKSLPSESEAHRSLTLALLLYAKLSLGPAAKSGPSFEILDGKFVDRLFSSYALLEYAARHWQAHLLASDFNAGGQLRLTDECRAVFPDSYRFVLLAWSIDRSLSQSASELIRHFEFSLEVQEACFGKGHVATLQTLIVLAKIQAATHGKGHQQFHYFYRAACVGEQDLHRFAAVVSVCAEHFLRHTETLTVAKRTEIATQRERMIRLLIKISVIRDGFSSDAVAYWYGVLFRLYITIKEYKMAIALKEEYDREVAAVGICQSGRHQIHHMYQNAGDLLINFKGEAQEMADPDYSKLFLEVGNDTQDDKNRVSLLLATALSYELQEKWTQAERIHMSLWKRIRADRAPEYTPSTKFRIAIQYAKFLRKQERIEEASDLLIGLWKEYESCTFDKEVIILIREVAVLLRSLDRPQLSISVLTKVWEWFKNEGHTDDEDAVMTSVIITEVTQEITNTTVTTTVETTEISKTLQHIFEARLEAWRNGVFDGVLFNSCLALASLYIRQKDWTCAVSVLEKTLEAAWKVILVAEIAVDAKLPERFATKCIRIAACLASCYDRQGHFDKAETIYLRAFRFCLASSDITNGNAQDCLAKLVRFYEKHWWSERAIKAYREFLDVCRSRLGRTHTLVIQTLYEVAEYAESLKRRDAYEYYVEVVEVLNEGCSHCHADALKAAVHLVKYYARYELCKRLRDICTVLWATFVHHREGVVFTEETVQLIYDEYVRVLELGNAEASVVYKISGEFLQAAKEVFGELAAIVSKARIAFADACERHEQHFIEAIQNYEELIKTATITDTTKTTIMTIKERLVTVYVKVIMSGGATTLEAGTIDRAIALCLELYYEFRADFGCWSEKTLLRLRDVIVLYQCLDAVGSLNKVVELIRAAFIDIVTTECKAASLFRAAEILASIVAMTSLADLGLELAFQARRWIVFGKVFEQGTGVTLGPGMSPSKESFVFIVSFEQRVGRAVIMTYSELMASHRRERYLLSQYQAAAGKDIKAELECGAELRAFWLELQQERLRHMLEQDLFNSFKAKYSNFIRTEDDEGMLTFFLALLASLNEERNGTDFATLVCLVANAQVRDLIAAGQFVQALKVATSAFYFANRQRFYTDQRRIAYAYKLAGLMAGIDCGKPDSSLEEEYLKLSREITTEALGILGKIEIDIVRLGFEDRNGIIRLLGRQQNYKELEVRLRLHTSYTCSGRESWANRCVFHQTLLGKLWQSVRAHKSREVKLIVSIGRLMVHARAAAKSPQEAIRFCETLHYNLCQSRGILDPVTINMSEVLASLYTNVNQFGHAARLYQQILGEIEVVLRGGRSRSHDHRNGDQHQHQHHSQQQLHSCTAAGLKLTESELVKVAGRQLELLMYARLRGGNWEGCLPRLIETYARLRAALPAGKAAPGLSVPEPRVWAAQASADDAAGQYAPPGDAEWQLDGSDRPGPGPGPRRVGSAWSINHTLVARHACGTTWEQTEEGGK